LGSVPEQERETECSQRDALGAVGRGRGDLVHDAQKIKFGRLFYLREGGKASRRTRDGWRAGLISEEGPCGTNQEREVPRAVKLGGPLGFGGRGHDARLMREAFCERSITRTYQV
jgi:hypothetical protein